MSFWSPYLKTSIGYCQRLTVKGPFSTTKLPILPVKDNIIKHVKCKRIQSNHVNQIIYFVHHSIETLSISNIDFNDKTARQFFDRLHECNQIRDLSFTACSFPESAWEFFGACIREKQISGLTVRSMPLTTPMSDIIIDSLHDLTMLNFSDIKLIGKLDFHQLICKLMDSQASIDSLFLLDFDIKDLVIDELRVLKDNKTAKVIVYNRDSSFEIIN